MELRSSKEDGKELVAWRRDDTSQRARNHILRNLKVKNDGLRRSFAGAINVSLTFVVRLCAAFKAWLIASRSDSVGCRGVCSG